MVTIEDPKISDKTEAKEVPVIQIRDLNKSFGDNHVLCNFNIDLYKGENLAVVGKSGSGKSVLIKCIIGLMKPDSGTIFMFEKNIPDLDSAGLDDIRAKAGFLFQSNALYDSMTVRENLEFPLRRHRVGTQAEKVNDLVMEALTNVGLSETVDMMPAELSGGMRKRVALARTLILKPQIIFYDEPTTGLDPITGKEISNLILKIQKLYQTSSIIISHDMNCIKITSNRVVLLIDGTCYAEGTYEELKKSDDKKINQFFE
ncbi:MAG: ATP-binding cassette domain-containing protein [Bacteroidota bacterium]